MHCASLGEFEQGRPVLEAIREQYPETAILLTFFSPSGFEIRKDYEGADYVFYLPLDSKRNARKFIDIVQPKLALFVKYEFWFHYLKTLNRKGIPTILFAAHFQQNQPFFKPFGGLFRQMLSFYSQIFVQDKSSKTLLESIGQNRVQVAGDTRFDRMAKVLASPKDFPEVVAFKQKKKLIVVGSSWAEDESFLKKVFYSIPEQDYKLLIIPHEIQEQHIQRILDLFGSDACLWSASVEVLKSKKVAVVQTMGQLSFLYRYADVAWVGGGFGKGIHNILEPGVFGIPVFFGPRYQRFREAVEMCDIGGAVSITKEHQLTALLKDSQRLKEIGKVAGHYVADHLGATKKIMDYLAEKCFAKVS
jgi:3-deoxy-D-manno-octulosonic-acid transferase